MCRGDTRIWTVNAHPLCQSYYGCPNGTVTNHSSTGHECGGGQGVGLVVVLVEQKMKPDTLEQDRGITGCSYSMQSAIYIMYNTHFIKHLFYNHLL